MTGWLGALVAAEIALPRLTIAAEDPLALARRRIARQNRTSQPSAGAVHLALMKRNVSSAERGRLEIKPTNLLTVTTRLSEYESKAPVWVRNKHWFNMS